MELKLCRLASRTTRRHNVLIEPLWNWNVILMAVPFVFISINRTFMELKPFSCPCCRWCFPCINRTFMELKLILNISTLMITLCINRTFMELKRKQDTRSIGHTEVLIEPLWNWNSTIYSNNVRLECINRTFMELKLIRTKCRASKVTVLIEPLWNWNGSPRTEPPTHERINRTFMELKPAFRCWRC